MIKLQSNEDTSNTFPFFSNSRNGQAEPLHAMKLQKRTKVIFNTVLTSALEADERSASNPFQTLYSRGKLSTVTVEYEPVWNRPGRLNKKKSLTNPPPTRLPARNLMTVISTTNLLPRIVVSVLSLAKQYLKGI